MKLASISVRRYDLRLERSIPLRDTNLSVRSGLILTLQSDSGHSGYGDIAPLPGFSGETLDEATEQALSLSDLVITTELPSGDAPLGWALADWVEHHAMLAPSVRFGIESALLNLISQVEGVPLSKILAARPRDSVSVCGLVIGSGDLAVQQARHLTAQGYRALKIKVGRKPVQEDIAFVHLMRQSVGNDIALRVDANRAWEMNDAIAFANGVRDCAIEYVEEPLADSSALAEFHTATDFPVALDESLVGLDPKTFTPFPGVTAFILKPTILGGIEHTQDWIRRANDCGITPVISAAFESGAGINILAQLAACITGGDAPVGLDTYGWLAEDVLSERLDMKNGHLDLAQADATASHIDATHLRTVEHV
ncbi:MAG: o-succinylbenzoate synthase [Candidatus Hydrogenedentes bacterium]|nr:o-succinylbenzoate synthase [Candidatus Hydrogenedentota bacterium]